MQDLIWLLPTYPVLGFFTLVLTAGRLPKNIVAIIGAGSVGLSFFTAVIIATQFLSSGENYFIKEVWTIRMYNRISINNQNLIVINFICF